MPAEVLLALIILQRVAELVLAARNTRRLRALGAEEHGAAHYPFIVMLHVAWLVAIAMAGAGLTVGWAWVAAWLALQALRVWTLASLGPRWTTRILILPGVPPVRSGPYRWLPHPNYLIVAAELALVPLALGAPGLALAFTLLNSVAMAVRIPTEARALRRAGDRRADPP